MMNLAEFYQGRRVLVTGGKGFIGSALCDALRKLGAVVYPFDKKDRGPDMTDPHHVHTLAGEFRPALVFHLAALTEVGRSHSSPADCYRTNFGGTLNVLDWCRRAGNVPVVVASSDKAYGEWPADQLPYREDGFDVFAPARDPYSASKRHADLLAQEYAALYDLPVRIARPCNVYGPGQRNETTLITSTILKLLRGEPAVIHDGAGSILREWMYVEDMVKAYLLLGMDTGNKGDVAYNVGSGEVMSVGGTVYGIHSVLGTRKQMVGYTGGPPQTRDQYLDSTRFRKRFPGWCPVGLAAGLQLTVEWYKENYDL